MLLNMAFSLIHLIAEICNSHGFVSEHQLLL